MITYHPGQVDGIMGPQLPFVVSELLPPGEISFTADPQLGKAVIVAGDWKEMCDKAVQYFSLRKPVGRGHKLKRDGGMTRLFVLN